MADQLTTLEIRDGIAVITNNRPEKHNAANDAMDRQLFDALDEIHERKDVRVVLWRGEGKSFSSGRDVGVQVCVRRRRVYPAIARQRGTDPAVCSRRMPAALAFIARANAMEAPQA